MGIERYGRRMIRVRCQFVVNRGKKLLIELLVACEDGAALAHLLKSPRRIYSKNLHLNY